VPKASFISANDLLAFLLFSRKPNAYQLRKWLVDEVLPSIDTYIADANSREDSLLYAMNKFRQVRKVRQAQQDDMIKDAMRVIAVWIEQAPKSHVQMLHDALVGSEPK
jgi:prophage antirepressor-like protein